MLDKLAARPRGRPRKQPDVDSTRKQRATFCGASRAREGSDKFIALCDLSLRWQDEHGGAKAVTIISK
jgi:hypothetical protein